MALLRHPCARHSAAEAQGPVESTGKRDSDFHSLKCRWLELNTPLKEASECRSLN